MKERNRHMLCCCCGYAVKEEVEDDELYDKFGIDEKMLKSLMTKEKDEKGNIKITWGEQKIV